MENKLELLKTLRDLTKAGVADCKNALKECNDDFDKAVEWLRLKGILKAAKLQNNTATEGAVISYIHPGNRLGVLLEVNCQTDFVAHTDEFKSFCKDVAMHIAGRDPFPLYTSPENIPLAILEKEMEFIANKANEDPKFEKKPQLIRTKILDGQLDKWKKEVSLLDQSSIKDDKKTINDLMLELSAKTGEKISIARFTRFELGRN